MALRLTGKARTCNTKQKKLRYVVNQLEKAAQNQVMPYCNEETGEVNLESLKKLLEILDLAFGDQNKAATV